MAVKNYLKQNLDDPDSYKSASWYGFTYNKQTRHIQYGISIDIGTNTMLYS